MPDTLHVSALFGPAALTEAVGRGLVREQAHPELPLRILNYTEKAQAERAWNEVTLACRGLIVDDDGRVVARPFPPRSPAGTGRSPRSWRRGPSPTPSRCRPGPGPRGSSCG
ncbi:hypothetical protein [Planobispora longispora]|uniref:Uncharacterized protein n=1 Tax=Planobispora longispora TaxID=28887 RepID=A0A8J3RU67_9ACTN|nr:hypothetical protein [Planobispora longispora]BFE88305.1 hypothetical protein GCM10020093_109060 [Planobispora longispora]GIH79629.1 hypothetical protein Plo01_60580 [Planobispora longispora]